MTQSEPLKPRRKIRLLPVVIVGVAVLLAVRLGELSFGVELSPASPALAAEDSAEDAPDSEQPAEHGTEKPSESTAKDGDAAESHAKEDRRSTDFPVEFTPAEVAVLQDLASRRDELVILEKELDARERLLGVTEGRLEKRIDELQQLRESIETLVRQYNEQEKSELQSIVKIYETMKPKDAASILADLDMRILLGIMESMKERKSAPILAAMKPERAREVTAELARKREIDLSTPSSDNKPSG